MLLLKLTLTPFLIAIVTLIGIRWGAKSAGWVAGLPLTSGPISAFLAVQHGHVFATTAAVGTIAGAANGVGFAVAYCCAGYAVSRRRHPIYAQLVLSVLTGVGVFIALTWTLRNHVGSLLVVTAGSLTSILAGTWVLGQFTKRAGDTAPQARPAVLHPQSFQSVGRRILSRMVVATAFTILLTSMASRLGPDLSGLLTPVPIFAVVIAVFSHMSEGFSSAVAFLRGFCQGSFAFVAFFLVVVAGLAPLGALATYLLATLTSVMTQGLLLAVTSADRRARHLSRGA